VQEGVSGLPSSRDEERETHTHYHTHTHTSLPRHADTQPPTTQKKQRNWALNKQDQEHLRNWRRRRTWRFLRVASNSSLVLFLHRPQLVSGRKQVGSAKPTQHTTTSTPHTPHPPPRPTQHATKTATEDETADTTTTTTKKRKKRRTAFPIAFMGRFPRQHEVQQQNKRKRCVLPHAQVVMQGCLCRTVAQTEHPNTH